GVKIPPTRSISSLLLRSPSHNRSLQRSGYVSYHTRELQNPETAHEFQYIVSTVLVFSAQLL
ncbi:MAG: hypothetical protein ACXV7G_13510, partial [Halobacteriota archaeon]